MKTEDKKLGRFFNMLTGLVSPDVSVDDITEFYYWCEKLFESDIPEIKGFEVHPDDYGSIVNCNLRCNESIPVNEIHCYYADGRIQKFKIV